MQKIECATIQRLEQRTLFSHPFGTVDKSFGGPDAYVPGKVTVDVSGSGDGFGGIVRDAIGNLFVGGDGGVARFTAEGIAADYGTDGVAALPSGDTFVAGAVDSHDRFYALTKSSNGVVLARYTAAGSLDRQFGTHGIAPVTSDVSFTAAAVSIESTGQLVVAGTASTNRGQGAEMRVFRLEPIGTPDRHFGSGGSLTVRVGTRTAAAPVIHDKVVGIRMLSDGSILVGGGSFSFSLGDDNTDYTSPYFFGVAKITADGQLDGSYGSGGIARVHFAGAFASRYPGVSANDFTLNVAFDARPDGRVIFAGDAYSSREFLATVSAAGVTTYKASWIPTSEVTYTNESTYGIAALSDSGAVLLTYEPEDGDAGLTSISSSNVIGETITTFGEQDVLDQVGTLTSATPSFVIEPNGKIVVAGVNGFQYILLGLNQGDGFTPAFNGFPNAAENSVDSISQGYSSNGFYNQTAVAYYSTKAHSLMFAQTFGNGIWTTPVVIPQTRGVSQHFSLKLRYVINSYGAPYLAYYDPTSQSLKLARSSNRGKTWTVTTLDSGPDVGAFASLNFSSKRTPEVTYYDPTHQAVKFATESSTGKYYSTIIDSHVDVTDQSSSGTDLYGANLSVSYFDAATHRVLLARQKSDGLWTIDVAAKVKKSATGLSLSNTYLSGIPPFVVYYDTSRKELRDITFGDLNSASDFTAYTAAAGTFQNVSAVDGRIYAYDPESKTVVSYLGGSDSEASTLLKRGVSGLKAIEYYPADALLAYVDLKSGNLMLTPVDIRT